MARSPRTPDVAAIGRWTNRPRGSHAIQRPTRPYSGSGIRKIRRRASAQRSTRAVAPVPMRIELATRFMARQSATSSRIQVKGVPVDEPNKKDIEHLRQLSIFHFVGAGLSLAALAFIAVHFTIMNAVFSNPDLFKGAQGGPPPAQFFAM